nr:MAG TPA: hypothetical protein [Caudoviricetes sp.]
MFRIADRHTTITNRQMRKRLLYYAVDFFIVLVL